MNNGPGLGRAALVMALDFGLLVVATLLWRSYGWPAALAVAPVAGLVWYLAFRRGSSH